LLADLLSGRPEFAHALYADVEYRHSARTLSKPSSRGELHRIEGDAPACGWSMESAAARTGHGSGGIRVRGGVAVQQSLVGGNNGSLPSLPQAIARSSAATYKSIASSTYHALQMTSPSDSHTGCDSRGIHVFARDRQRLRPVGSRLGINPSARLSRLGPSTAILISTFASAWL